MYNVKIKNYGNGQVQVRLYSSGIYEGKKASPEKRPEEVNPFDGESVKIYQDFEEMDRECERSVMNSLKRAKGKIYDLSRANVWDWFATFTFSPDAVDRYDYECCSKKLSQWLKNMRKGADSDFRYLVVPERHKDGAFHFHGLLAGADTLGITDSGHFTKDGQKIYNIGKYKMGFTTATRVRQNEAVTKYITKYTTKDLIEHIKGKKKYWASRNLNLPEETTFALDYLQRQSLHNELVTDGCLHYKSVEYKINATTHNVRYYEFQMPQEQPEEICEKK